MISSKTFTKKKIVVFHPNLVGGGAERMIVNIVNGLNSDYFDITLALGEKTGAFLEEVTPSTHVEEIGIRKLRTKELLKLYSYLRAKKPDIIFGNWSRYNAGLCMIQFFLPLKIKLVIRETGVPGVPSFKIRKPILFLYRVFINKSDIIIAQSKDMYDGIIKTYRAKKKKIRIIHNAVDVEAISQKAQATSSLNKNKINLLAVGRFSFTMQKGFDLLLKTFSQLQDKQKYQLTFLGDGEMMEYHRKMAANLGIDSNVTFLGFCSNPYPYLREADILISSSKHEGFPNVVLESLVCGTPVLANNYKGGISEIIDSDTNGAICDIENVKEVEEQLKRVLKLKANSREISRQASIQWDKQRLITQLNTLFLEV